MKFRPCIDLRGGKVVQIVGGSLQEGSWEGPITHFQTERSAAYFARLYHSHQLIGGHVISLGPGNDEAALSALQAFPGGLQYGGGITGENAETFLDAGASHVIVTTYVFQKGEVDLERLQQLVRAVGKNRLVLDLSCKKKGGRYWVVTDRWQRFTKLAVTSKTLEWLSGYCDEFLVHGVDVEGKRVGVEEKLVAMLGTFSPIPVTYAGGVKKLEDLDRVKELGKGRVDLTIGSALDIFGGAIPFKDLLAWIEKEKENPS
jgi:phosphoribosylformimino-5-aminoimidazole carboxamide ribotide isomerase